MLVNSSFRSGSRKRGTRKQRISWNNHSIMANSEAIPISQKKLMDVLSTGKQIKNLESAYYPIRLKKDLMYDSNMLSKLQNFPGVMNMKSKRHKLKNKRQKLESKGKSPQSMRTYHNLYVAYIKGNSRPSKPAAKHGNFHLNGRIAGERRLHTSLNPGLRPDSIRKSSYAITDQINSMIQPRELNE